MALDKMNGDCEKMRDVEEIGDESRPGIAAKVGLRILAVVVFLLLFFVATSLAKVARPPSPVLGSIVAVIAFTVGGALWRLGGPSRRN